MAWQPAGAAWRWLWQRQLQRKRQLAWPRLASCFAALRRASAAPTPANAASSSAYRALIANTRAAARCANTVCAFTFWDRRGSRRDGENRVGWWLSDWPGALLAGLRNAEAAG